MSRTYLQLVNSVLTRLRDGTAISVSDNEDTLLIGEYVNEAKEWLEDKHEWTSLRTTIQVNLSTGEFSASLTGAGSRSNILQIINDTTDYEFGEAENYGVMNKLLTDNNQENQEPQRWDLNGIDGNNDPVINFHPKADQAYSINVNLIIPQDVLSSDSTVLTVPHLPVILYAHALAVEERGEEGGPPVDMLFKRAEDAALRAVTLDQSTVLDEFVWEII